MLRRCALRVLCEKADRFGANAKADLRKHQLPDADHDTAKTTLQNVEELVKEGEEAMRIAACPNEGAHRAMKALVEQLTIGFEKGQVSFYDLFSKNQITLKRKMMTFEPKGKGKGTGIEEGDVQPDVAANGNNGVTPKPAEASQGHADGGEAADKKS